METIEFAFNCITNSGDAGKFKTSQGKVSTWLQIPTINPSESLLALLHALGNYRKIMGFLQFS